MARAATETVQDLCIVARMLVTRIERLLRPLHLSFAGYEILVVLMTDGSSAMTCRTIGDRLCVHPTSISSALDRLEAAGYVRRTRDRSDGRAVLPALTGSGRRSVGLATDILNRDVFASLGIDDRQTHTLLRTLASFRANAGDY